MDFNNQISFPIRRTKVQKETVHNLTHLLVFQNVKCFSKRVWKTFQEWRLRNWTYFEALKTIIFSFHRYKVNLHGQLDMKYQDLWKRNFSRNSMTPLNRMEHLQLNYMYWNPYYLTNCSKIEVEIRPWKGGGKPRKRFFSLINLTH